MNNNSPEKGVQENVSTEKPSASGLSAVTKSLGVGGLALGVLTAAPAKAEDWQDMGAAVVANAAGDYIYCAAGNPEGGGDVDGDGRVEDPFLKSAFNDEGVSRTALWNGETFVEIDDLIAEANPQYVAGNWCVEGVDSSADITQLRYDDGISRNNVVQVEGLLSGRITNITEFNGHPYGMGNMRGGRVFQTDTDSTHSNAGAYEYSITNEPRRLYTPESGDFNTVVVNPDTDQIIASKNTEGSLTVVKVDNFSSSPRETNLNVPTPGNVFDGATPDGSNNVILITSDGIVHTLSDLDSESDTGETIEGGITVNTLQGNADGIEHDVTDGTVNIHLPEGVRVNVAVPPESTLNAVVDTVLGENDLTGSSIIIQPGEAADIGAGVTAMRATSETTEPPYEPDQECQENVCDDEGRQRCLSDSPVENRQLEVNPTRGEVTALGNIDLPPTPVNTGDMVRISDTLACPQEDTGHIDTGDTQDTHDTSVTHDDTSGEALDSQDSAVTRDTGIPSGGCACASTPNEQGTPSLASTLMVAAALLGAYRKKTELIL